MQRVRDVVEAWRADARIGLAILVVAAVVIGVIWYRIGIGAGSESPPRRQTLTSTSPQSAPASAGSGTSSTTDRRDGLVVHVAGAVSTPGVVELAAGARVIDAVEAAGGALEDADLDRLNLAAKVADGQRILVPRVGEPGAPDVTSSDGVPGGSDGTSAPDGLVNLNTASSTDLEALPGIGPVLAAAILAERERRGGFRSVQELRDVHGIGEKRYAELASLVTV